MQDVPIQLLYDFLVFAESASMDVAAEKLGITQPALSKRLKSLEKFLPSPVFSQSGKRKVLTAFGEDLREKLKLRFQGLQEEIAQACSLQEDPARARVRIAARREVLDRLANRLHFPGEIHFMECPHDEIIHLLRERKVELGITHVAPDSHELVARPLFREKFRFVLPKRHFHEIPTTKEFAQTLLGLPCLGYKEKDEVLFSACQSRGIDIDQIRFHRITANYQSLAKMVDAGLGWSVLPAYFPVSETRNWISEISAQVFDPREFKVLYRSELSNAAWIKELLREIIGVWRPG